MHNEDIRNYAGGKGVRLWQVAMKLGINDGNLSRRLRLELSDEEKEKIKAIIDEISSQQ